MKKLVYLLMAMPLLLTSCSKDEEVANEEIVQVSFSAKLPKKVQSRSEKTVSQPPVNQVICAVFENGVELTNLRETINLTPESTEIMFEPRLIKGKTYKVAFWASNTIDQGGTAINVYQTSDMTQITRNNNVSAEESVFDAFTANSEIIVSAVSQTKDIKLRRPFAKLNIGVTEDDWNTMKNVYGLTPSKMEVTIKNVKNTFDAITGSVVGTSQDITYTIPIAGNGNLECEGETYKHMAMCFVMAEMEKENIAITYDIYGNDNENNEKIIREDVALDAIPMQNNFNTNIVGGLMTGTITYNISFESDFDDSEHKEEIE